jgi:hypothetical protein
MSETIVIEGGCLCGAVRFGLTELPQVASYCHCTRCQRRTGTGASMSAAIDPANFRLLAGEQQMGSWLPPDGGNGKYFCASCGAHMYAQSPDGTRMSIRMGAFDRDPGLRPSYHQYVAYAAPWDVLPDDGLPRYDEARPS